MGTVGSQKCLSRSWVKAIGEDPETFSWMMIHDDRHETLFSGFLFVPVSLFRWRFRYISSLSVSYSNPFLFARVSSISS